MGTTSTDTDEQLALTLLIGVIATTRGRRRFAEQGHTSDYQPGIALAVLALLDNMDFTSADLEYEEIHGPEGSVKARLQLRAMIGASLIKGGMGRLVPGIGGASETVAHAMTRVYAGATKQGGVLGTDHAGMDLTRMLPMSATLFRGPLGYVVEVTPEGRKGENWEVHDGIYGEETINISEDHPIQTMKSMDDGDNLFFYRQLQSQLGDNAADGILVVTGGYTVIGYDTIRCDNFVLGINGTINIGEVHGYDGADLNNHEVAAAHGLSLFGHGQRPDHTDVNDERQICTPVYDMLLEGDRPVRITHHLTMSGLNMGIPPLTIHELERGPFVGQHDALEIGRMINSEYEPYGDRGASIKGPTLVGKKADWQALSRLNNLSAVDVLIQQEEHQRSRTQAVATAAVERARELYKRAELVGQANQAHIDAARKAKQRTSNGCGMALPIHTASLSSPAVAAYTMQKRTGPNAPRKATDVTDVFNRAMPISKQERIKRQRTLIEQEMIPEGTHVHIDNVLTPKPDHYSMDERKQGKTCFMMWGGGNRRRANQKHTYDTVPLNIYPHRDVHHDTPVPRVRVKYESCQHQTKRHRNLPDSKQGEITDGPGTTLPTKLSKTHVNQPSAPRP